MPERPLTTRYKAVSRDLFGSPLARRIYRLLPDHKDTAIAGIVGCSREYVRQVRWKAGIPTPQDMENRRRLKTIRSMAKAGRTSSEIAEVLGLRSPIIRSIARKNGIEVIKDKPGISVDSRKVAKLKDHIAKGGNFFSAAREIGVHFTTIFRWKKKLGLKRRYKEGWR